MHCFHYGQMLKARKVVLLYVVVLAMNHRAAGTGYHVMQHLATKAPYAHRVPVPNAPSIHATEDPVGYKPVYLYLVARHGTRWPTAGRARQMAKLVHLLKNATAPEHQWAVNWTCPVHDVPYLAGELHDTGVQELYSLGVRVRDRFPNISTHRYYPKRFPIVSTQVARAAQSANAFALGFFSPPDPAAVAIQGTQQTPEDSKAAAHGQSSLAGSEDSTAAAAVPSPQEGSAEGAAAAAPGMQAGEVQQSSDSATGTTDSSMDLTGSSSSSHKRGLQEQPGDQPSAKRLQLEASGHAAQAAVAGPGLNGGSAGDLVSSSGTSSSSSTQGSQQLDVEVPASSSSRGATRLKPASPVPALEQGHPNSNGPATGATASAFAAADVHGGHAKHAVHAVALTMAPKKQDLLLRFYDACPAYKHHERQVERWLAPWLMSHWAPLAPLLEQRLGLPGGVLTAGDVDALWQLCSFEAGVLGLTQACALFTHQEAQLMEWLEDVRLYEVQGYGSPINYQIAAPLLEDIANSVLKAAAAALDREQPQPRAGDTLQPNTNSDGSSSSSWGIEDHMAASHGGLDAAQAQQHAPHHQQQQHQGFEQHAGPPISRHRRKRRHLQLQLAKFHFAHCETLTPLAALLGLFQPTGAEAAAEPSASIDLEAQLLELAAGAPPPPPAAAEGAARVPEGVGEGAGGEVAGATGPSAAAGWGAASLEVDATDDVLYALMEQQEVQDMTAQQAAQQAARDRSSGQSGESDPVEDGDSSSSSSSSSSTSTVTTSSSSSSADSTGRSAASRPGGSSSASDQGLESDATSTSSSSSSSGFLYRGKRWIADPAPPPEGWVPYSRPPSRHPSVDSSSNGGSSNDDSSSITNDNHGSSNGGSSRNALPTGTPSSRLTGDDPSLQQQPHTSGGTNSAVSLHQLGNSSVGAVQGIDPAEEPEPAVVGEVPAGDRIFRGGRVSPLGANFMVVVYQREEAHPATEAADKTPDSKTAGAAGTAAAGAGWLYGGEGGLVGEVPPPVPAGASKRHLQGAVQHRSAGEDQVDHNVSSGSRSSITPTGSHSSSSRGQASSILNSLGDAAAATAWGQGAAAAAGLPADVLASDQFLVRVVWNEQLVQMPGCSGTDLSLGEFLECVVGDKPHLSQVAAACGWSPQRHA